MTLGGSSTICLPPGASCSGGCRQNTLGHGLPLPGARERLPLGMVSTGEAATWARSLSWLACHPCHPPREALRSPSSQNIAQATGVPASNHRVSKYKCHLNPMATEPSITISQPNGSADFSSTENRYWLRSRPTPGEQGSAGCLENRGKEGRDVRLESSRSCPGWAAPWPTRSRLSALFKLLSQTCPFHHLPKAVAAALAAAPALSLRKARSSSAADAAAAPARPLSGAQATSCRKSRLRSQLNSSTANRAAGSFSPLPLPATW